jgi:hypothetical protein
MAPLSDISVGDSLLKEIMIEIIPAITNIRSRAQINVTMVPLKVLL